MADPNADARRLLALIYQRNDKESSRSLTDYMQRVIVDSRPEPRVFGEIAESWQHARTQRWAGALEFVAGIRKSYDGPMNFYEGWGKGHDKTSATARILNWLLAYSPKENLRLYTAAKDADQAALIRDAMVREANLNSQWLGKRLDFKQKFVHGRTNGAVLEILASDASGAQGKAPDGLVFDELTNWGEKGREMFDSLYSSAVKRGGHCFTMILSNAGHKETWQFGVRNLAADSHGDTWSFFEQPQNRVFASWMTPAAIAEYSRLLSPGEAKRLYGNVWQSLSEDRGAFREEDVDKCIGTPLSPPPGATAVICVDFGGVIDRTAMTVVFFDGQRIHVTSQTVWQGNHQNEIQVENVGKWVDDQLKKYPKAVVVFDIHQLLEQAQRLERKGVNLVRFNHKSGRNNFLMLDHLRTLLSNKKVVFGQDAGYLNGETLQDELKSVITRKMSYGERLDHLSSQHDDRVASLGMACLEAIKHPPVTPMSLGKSQQQTPPLRDRVGSVFSQDHLARRNLYGSGG